MRRRAVKLRLNEEVLRGLKKTARKNGMSLNKECELRLMLSLLRDDPEFEIICKIANAALTSEGLA